MRRVMAVTLTVVGLVGGLVAQVATPASAAVPATASRLVPLPPTRLVDTREGLGVAGAGRVATDGVVTIVVAGQAGVPTTGASAVVLNVTMTDTTGPGFLTLWPEGATRPTVSSVNATAADQTVANLAVVPLPASGRVQLFAHRATHVVVDVAGYFTASAAGARAGRFVPLTPSRILDTREGNGAPARRPASGGTTALAVAGRGGVPASGAAAVALTLTATESTSAGYVTAWPGGLDRPLASNLNLPGAGATVANTVIVPVGADGKVNLYTQRSTHLVADVVGWFTGDAAASSTDGLYVPIAPTRAFDSRVTGARLWARYRRDLTFDLGASAAGVIANLTITDTGAPLYLTAYPAVTRRPLASNVNADGPGSTRANLAVLPLTAGNRASVYPSDDTELVVDVAGWFTGTPLPAEAGVAAKAPALNGSPSLAGFDAEVTAFLDAKGATGASVAVSRNGKLVYVRSYGQSDASTGEAARVDSRFRIASMSKPLAATAAMRLVERGELSLSTRVWPLIDGRVPLPEGADPRTALITVRDLLEHSSGFLGWMDPFFNDTREVVDAFGPEGASSCEAGASWFLTWPLAYEPGKDSIYTNMDYCLLGLVIEQVTRRPWAEVVAREVLIPAGMRNERVARTRNDRLPFEAVHVTPAAGEIGGGWFMEGLGPAGAWLGTAADLVRFLDRLADGTLVSPSTLAAMKAAPAYADGTGWWGLGLRAYDNGTSFGHTGSLKNARGMEMHRADGTTWAILVNGTFPDHGDQPSALMARAIAAVPAWPAVDLGPDVP